jgi:hypothetical protein
VADPREILRAAQLAMQQGRTDDAEFLMDQYEAARDTAPPALPRAEVRPQPWARPGLTAERQAVEVEERTAAALAPRLEVQPGEEQRTREQIQRDIERERGALLTAGGGVQAPADAGILPPFRPTRIEQGPDGALLYRGPDGSRAPATTAQLLVEAFAQQHVLTEEQAREMAAVAEQMPADTLRQRFSRYLASPTGALQASTPGAGVVETPLGATLRGVLGLGSAVVGETVFGDNPISFPVQKALASALLPEGTDQVPSRQDPTLECPYDPEGRRVASTDPSAVRRVAENLAAGRTLMDEFSDQPGIRAAVGPEAAYWLGLPAELLTPANVGLVTAPLRAAGVGGRVVAAAERAVAPTAKAAAIEAAGRVLEGDALEAATAAIRAAPDDAAAIEAAVRPLSAPAADSAAAAMRSAQAPAGGLVAVSDDLLLDADVAADLRPRLDEAVGERLAAGPRDVAPPRLMAFLDPAHPLRAEIPEELARLAGDYRTWEELPAALATALRSHVRTTEAARLAAEVGAPVRWAAETSVAKVLDPRASGEFWWTRLPPGALRSVAQRVASRGVLPTAQAARSLRELQAAGEAASRALRRDLVREARQGPGAVERLFVEKSAGDHEEAWARLFRGMFSRQAGAYLEAAQPTLRTADGEMIAPSVEAIREVVRYLQSTGRVADSALVRHRMSDYQLQRRLLATLLGRYYRAEAGARVAEYDRLSRLVVGEAGSLSAARTAEGALPLAEDARLGFQLDPAASAAEARLAGDLDRLPVLAERMNVPAALNDSMMSLGASAAEWAAQTGKAVLQRLQHGWILPNIPLYLGRLTTAPLVPLLTLGLSDGASVIGGVARAAGRAGRWMPREAGIRTPDGMVYSPAQIDDLAQTFSLGLSRTESERVGQLGQDLARAAERAAPEGAEATADTRWLNPAARAYWMAQAEALEVWARRSTFEDGLRLGLSPTDAAARARRAFFDYGAAPEIVRETLGRWLYSASHQHMLLSTLAERAVGQAPAALTAAAKGLREQQRAADPYGLDGDALLKHLGVKVVGDQRFYGPEVGLFGPVDAVLRAARWGNVLTTELSRAVADMDLDAIRASAGRGMEGALLGAGEQILGGTTEAIRAMEAFSSDPATARSPQRQDEAAFWAAAIWAAHTDAWPMFERVMQPVKVKPPKESAHYLAGVPNSGMEFAWSRQPPEGVPHIAVGTDGTGEPIYYVIKPSPQGLANLRAIRAATPDRIEGVAAGVAGAWIDEAGAAVAGEGRSLYPEWAVPRGWRETAATLVGTPAGVSDTEQERLRQVERLRQIREGE